MTSDSLPRPDAPGRLKSARTPGCSQAWSPKTSTCFMLGSARDLSGPKLHLLRVKVDVGLCATSRLGRPEGVHPPEHRGPRLPEFKARTSTFLASHQHV